ncbi:hypothetical protein [Nocardioides speluncae]|uniref:hypothetical protein n=1 Tax=Nocardioides speluncae TaxID=2670337 RepID=UPI000D68E6CA|nr:hypothetical protein [Nocardioides speluncae]
MNLRRTLLTAAASAATGLTLLAAPVAAQPVLADDPTVTARAASSAPVCETAVYAFTQSQRFVRRVVRKTTVPQKDYLSTTSMRFKVKSSAHAFAPRDNQVGVLTVNGDFRARHLVFSVNRQTKKYKLVQTKVLLNRNFRQRLIVPASGANYYTVDPAGTLLRWEFFRNSKGQLFLGNRTLVKRGLGNLKTLAYYKQARFDGVAYNVLVGTTKQGAVQQIRVPVQNPARTKVLTLQATGFKRYEAISPSICMVDGKPDWNHATLTMIDTDSNLAHFYGLKPFLRPAEPVITNHGRIARSLNWRLHAAY